MSKQNYLVFFSSLENKVNFLSEKCRKNNRHLAVTYLSFRVEPCDHHC